MSSHPKDVFSLHKSQTSTFDNYTSVEHVDYVKDTMLQQCKVDSDMYYCGWPTIYLLYILELFIFIPSANEHPNYTCILVFHSGYNYVWENVNGFDIRTYIILVLRTQ